MSAIISPAEPLALRVSDACKALGVGKTWLYGKAKAGELKMIRLGGRTVVPMSELRRLLSANA